jgi:hypothetical protein
VALLLAVLMMGVSAWGACPQTVFEFQGQPDCVSLVYAPPHITVTNTCVDPVLVDASVQLHRVGASVAVVSPGSALNVLDLSAFSLGMNGEIYSVIALVSAVEGTCEESALQASEAPRVQGEGETAGSHGDGGVSPVDFVRS